MRTEHARPAELRKIGGDSGEDKPARGALARAHGIELAVAEHELAQSLARVARFAGDLRGHDAAERLDLFRERFRKSLVLGAAAPGDHHPRAFAHLLPDLRGDLPGRGFPVRILILPRREAEEDAQDDEDENHPVVGKKTEQRFRFHHHVTRRRAP